MSRPTLVPAYGRDYKSKAAVKADLLAGKDFILNQFGSPWDGKPCSFADIEAVEFNVRYGKLRKVAVFNTAELQFEGG
jgi:hypothetical protein